MRVLVTGDRNWDDADLIEKHLKKLPKGSVVIEGGARGADTLAKGAATRLGFKVEEYKADWGRYKRAAGPIRNKQMLEEGKPDKGLAFHDDIEHSKGTKNMIAQLEKAGVPVELVSHELSQDHMLKAFETMYGARPRLTLDNALDGKTSEEIKKLFAGDGVLTLGSISAGKEVWRELWELVKKEKQEEE